MTKKTHLRKGRSVDKTGRSKSGDKHVRLHQWLMQSEAWKSLDPHERAVLIELYSFYNGNNNGHLFLSVRMAADRCNMGKDKAGKCFKALEEKGFIRRRADEPEDYSLREAHKWILTEFDFRGRAATKDFMTWRLEKQNQRPQSRTSCPQSRTEQQLTFQKSAKLYEKADNITPFRAPHCPQRRTQL